MHFLRKSLLIPVLAVAGLTGRASAETAYFLAGGGTLETAARSQAYVIPISDPASIAQARAILAGRPSTFAATNYRLRVRIASGSDGINLNYFSPARTPWFWRVTEFVRFVFVDYSTGGGAGTGDPVPPPDLPDRAYEASPAEISLDPAAFIATYGNTIELWGYSLMGEVTPGAASSAVLNLSTRGRVGTSDDVLIAGVVVPPGPPKNVLLRVLGPSLSASGVQNVLVNPKMELFAGGTKVLENDDWASSPRAAEIGAMPAYKPGDSREPALLTTLFPGAYTIIVSGVNGTTGVALVEIYDLDPH